MISRNESQREQRRFFAIASLGRDRWYWVVWPSLEEVQASDEPILHVGEGYEQTKAEAVEKALELAGNYAKWVAAKYARVYHLSKGTTSHITQGSKTPLRQEFLYRDVYDSQSKQWVSVPHRVVTRTSKYVYVEQQPYSPDDLTEIWPDRELHTFRLDRRALEQGGYAFVPATTSVAETEEPIFFTYDRMRSQGNQAYGCLQVLNLSWPCTVAEVKAAYRILVKSAHPDGGGSQETFLALQEAYGQALQLAQLYAEMTGSPTGETKDHD